MSFTLATWNINSVRLREALVARLMTEEAPDVLCLQECKSPVEKMPLEAFAALGYGHVAARGQKGYNGVAILSKMPLEEVGSEDFASLETEPWQRLRPNAEGDWINMRDPAFDAFIPCGDKDNTEANTIFDMYSQGVLTSRDAWADNSGRDALAGKQQVFVLERTDAPLSGEPPLTREIRAAMGQDPDWLIDRYAW
ncbi:MAG: endonuclease/exonuclease/phosphatase family protein, partial [Maritimibacter sp.]